MKTPRESDTPEPSSVAEFPRLDSSPTESRDVIIKEKLEAFSDMLSNQGVDKFWEALVEKNPDAAKGIVTKKELFAKVTPSLRNHIAKVLPAINILVVGAKNPEQSFQEVSTWLRQTAVEFAEKDYESLVNFKKSGTDPLTTLPNRSVFDRNMKVGIERNRRFKETFSFIFFDLDHFKAVNDTYGHDAGDAVLKEMARRLKDVKLRGLDLLARFGGEEFAVVLPSTPKEGACILAQRISEQISSQPFIIKSNSGETFEIPVTVSVGVTQFTDAESDPDGKGVLNEADSNLYILKRGIVDAEGNVIKELRGLIACDGKVVTQEDIEAYKIKMSGVGRSSFPAPRSSYPGPRKAE